MRSDLPVKGNADSKHTWIVRVSSPLPWFIRLISPPFPNAWVWASYFAVPITGASRSTLPHPAPGSTPAMSAPFDVASHAKERPTYLA